MKTTTTFHARSLVPLGAALALAAAGCGPGTHDHPHDEEAPVSADAADAEAAADVERRLDQYTTVRLEADVSALTDAQRAMIPHLIEAARAMDEAFWLQAYGEPEPFLAGLDGPLRRFAEINYGPWDRLADNEPFVPGVGPKPPGARFYPEDMTAEELEAAAAASPERAEALRSHYTVVRRGEGGELLTVPYSEAYAEHYRRAADALRAAAALAEDPGLRRYLELRAEALLTDDYYQSDVAWMEMKDNTLDVVVGPIETYEDALLGAKAANEAYVLVKDREWSDRLSRYAALLPELQRGLPVAAEYKRERPGSDSDLGAYDVVYYAGDCNAGSKTIAINLPNDERVQLAKGTRRLQLKNAMRAKFDRILVPIAGVLIAPDQRPHVTFDAFFANTMFHEVAHGLGIKNTITGGGTVREALRDHASALEEGKADVLGLYMVSRLHERGELGPEGGELADYYVTFLGSIFRSIRFGAASAHGVANLVRFNFFREMGAFTRDDATGTYRVDPEKMAAAVDALSARILKLQGDGDYQGVEALLDAYGEQDETLTADLARLAEAGIPVDVVFEQGLEVLGLPAAQAAGDATPAAAGEAGR